MYEWLSANKLTLIWQKLSLRLLHQGRRYLTTYGKSLSYYKRKRNWTSNLRYMTVLAENARALVYRVGPANPPVLQATTVFYRKKYLHKSYLNTN